MAINFSAIRKKPFIGNLLQFPFRIISKEAKVRIIQGPLRGKKWIVGSSVHGCWLGSYELDKQRKFQQVVRSGDVVYDIGAHVGFYSLLASVLTGSRGRVYSFEPFERNLHFLRTHLSLNRISNCHVFPVAVSSSDGYSAFEITAEPAMAHLTSVPRDSTITVRTVTIDNLVATNRICPPDVIKCDIEGGEHEALIGARQTLRQFRPIIFLSTHGREIHEACCRELIDSKYSLAPLDHAALEQASDLFAASSQSTVACR